MTDYYELKIPKEQKVNLGASVLGTRNPQTVDLNAPSTLELVHRFNQQDTLVAEAVKTTLPEVARAVDAAADVLKAGGRITYAGVGTSGCLGVLDASERPPIFGVSHGLVVGLIAGGPGVLFKVVEGVGNSLQLGEDGSHASNLTAQDLVVRLTVSSRTPYVIGGLEYARSVDCVTVVISYNPDPPITYEAGIATSPVVGLETLTGLIRLKSGTVQKLVFNMVSTGTMVKFGRVYQSLMVDMQTTNVEPINRVCRMVAEATGIAHVQAGTLLKQVDYDAKSAILMVLASLDAVVVREKSVVHQGSSCTALEH